MQSSEVLDVLESETRFTAHELFAGEEADWYRVITNGGLEGWVSSKYVNLEY